MNICLFCTREYEPSRGKRQKCCSKQCAADIRRGKKLPPRSAEWSANISKANKGRKFALEHIEKLRLLRIGRKQNPEQIRKRLATWKKNGYVPKPPVHYGKDSHYWKGGVTKLPGYQAQKRRRRRNRKLNAFGWHTHEEWQALKEFYEFTCLRCRKKEPDIKLTVDHIIPLSRGGSDDIENIQPLCHSCNCKKHTEIIDYTNSTCQASDYKMTPVQT